MKEFSDVPVVRTLWRDAADLDTDGSEVTSDIASSDRTEQLETIADFPIDLSVDDVHEYFESIGELEMARYNSIGLYLGEKVQLDDGTYEYVNVRLMCYININNRDVSVKTASSYTYRIYTIV